MPQTIDQAERQAAEKLGYEIQANQQAQQNARQVQLIRSAKTARANGDMKKVARCEKEGKFKLQ